MGRARNRSVLLTGMMGAGKSRVGRALALSLGWDFLDTDTEVERISGMSIAEIFRRSGEAAFRALERRALEELPATEYVVALGGGAVVPSENRELLADKGTLVWLEARPETLAERIDPEDERPLIAGLDRRSRVERLRVLGAERAEAYEAAEIRVQTDGREVGEVCETILEALGRGDAA